MPEEDREGQIDRSASPPPPLTLPHIKEALHSLGRTPTVADLGPHSPGSCSPSLVLMRLGRTATPRMTRTHRKGPLSKWSLKNLPRLKPLQKRVWDFVVGPGEYLLASPRYVRDGEDDTDDQDMYEDEDVEAPFLAPKDDPTSRTPQDVQAALMSLKDNTATAKDIQVSSNDESVPELIDLGKGEDVPPSLPPKRVKHPTILGLDKKMATTAERSPIPPPLSPKVKLEKDHSSCRP